MSQVTGERNLSGPSDDCNTYGWCVLNKVLARLQEFIPRLKEANESLPKTDHQIDEHVQNLSDDSQSSSSDEEEEQNRSSKRRYIQMVSLVVE